MNQEQEGIEGILKHRILEFMCTNKGDSFDSKEIAEATGIELARVNILGRKIILDGYAKDVSSKDNASDGTIELLKIRATQDAFEGKVYEPIEQPDTIDDNAWDILSKKVHSPNFEHMRDKMLSGMKPGDKLYLKSDGREVIYNDQDDVFSVVPVTRI